MAVLTAASIAPTPGVVRGVRGMQSTESTCLRTTALRVFVEPPFLRSARAVWDCQKITGPTNRATYSGSVYAAVAAAAEESTIPAVTTESVRMPKKVGKGIVRLRLTRLGRKKRPFFRIIATHSSWRRDGKYIELLGHYNPLHAKDDLGIVVKADRIKYWLGVGAQPSDTVKGILHKLGILTASLPQEA